MVVIKAIINHADDDIPACVDVPSGGDIGILSYDPSTGLAGVAEVPLRAELSITRHQPRLLLLLDQWRE